MLNFLACPPWNVLPCPPSLPSLPEPLLVLQGPAAPYGDPELRTGPSCIAPSSSYTLPVHKRREGQVHHPSLQALCDYHRMQIGCLHQPSGSPITFQRQPKLRAGRQATWPAMLPQKPPRTYHPHASMDLRALPPRLRSLICLTVRQMNKPFLSFKNWLTSHLV